VEVVMRVRAAWQRDKYLFALLAVAAWLIAAMGAAVVAAAALHLATWLRLGPLSAHMGQHVLFMNAAAPLAAYMLLLVVPANATFRATLRPLAFATTAQLALLWGWHAPPVLAVAWTSPALLLAMHVSLFAAATLFWYAVFCMRGNDRWRPILALLVTGKLFCLLGALLVFAPRALYALAPSAHSAHAVSGISGLADQQLAGLIMIVACPLTYVTAGVIIAARWILELADERSALSTAKV
jgi:putative membrane protein